MKTPITLVILVLTIPAWLSEAHADDKTWQQFFGKASEPMRLSRIDREADPADPTKETFLELDHKLVRLSCNEERDLTLEYDFDERPNRKLVIPGDFEFVRFDLPQADDAPKIKRNDPKNAFRVIIEGASDSEAPKQADVGVVIRFTNEPGSPVRLVFSAASPERTERFREGYHVTMSHDLLEEIRAACPGSAGTPFKEPEQ